MSEQCKCKMWTVSKILKLPNLTIKSKSKEYMMFESILAKSEIEIYAGGAVYLRNSLIFNYAT